MANNDVEGLKFFGRLPFVADRPAVGNVFFVDSGHANASDSSETSRHGRDPQHPFATIDYAVGQCTASNGDYIFVAPSHTETVASAGALDLDVTGITIVGIGSGDQRPLINFTTSDVVDMDVDAEDIHLENFELKCSYDSLVAMVDVNDADFTMKDCYLHEAGTNYQALTFIDVNGGSANTCDRTKIIGCKIMQTGATSAVGDRAIELGEVADEVEIVGCVIDGDWDNAAIHNPTGKVLTNLLIKDCILANRATGQHAIELVSACTGFAVDNRLYGDTLGTIFDPGSLKCLGNKEVAAVDTYGVDSPYSAPAGADVHSDTTIILSDLKALVTKWDVFETLVSDFIVQYQSDNP